MADDILWSESSPRDFIGLRDGINAAKIRDEPAVLLYAGHPDWVCDPETHEPVRVSFARPLTDFDCRSCGAHIEGPVVVLFYPSVTRGGMWFTHPCPSCNKFVSGLLMPRERNGADDERHE